MRSNKKAVGFHQAAYKKLKRCNNYDIKQALYAKNFDRNLLPTPASYYSEQFPNMRIKSEWVKVCCPFHDDSNPSLSINMIHGGFKCWTCGVHGGDVLSFQIQRYKQTFKQAAIELGAWR